MPPRRVVKMLDKLAVLDDRERLRAKSENDRAAHHIQRVVGTLKPLEKSFAKLQRELEELPSERAEEAARLRTQMGALRQKISRIEDEAGAYSSEIRTTLRWIEQNFEGVSPEDLRRAVTYLDELEEKWARETRQSGPPKTSAGIGSILRKSVLWVWWELSCTVDYLAAYGLPKIEWRARKRRLYPAVDVILGLIVFLVLIEMFSEIDSWFWLFCFVAVLRILYLAWHLDKNFYVRKDLEHKAFLKKFLQETYRRLNLECEESGLAVRVRVAEDKDFRSRGGGWGHLPRKWVRAEGVLHRENPTRKGWDELDDKMGCALA